MSGRTAAFHSLTGSPSNWKRRARERVEGAHAAFDHARRAAPSRSRLRLSRSCAHRSRRRRAAACATSPPPARRSQRLDDQLARRARPGGPAASPWCHRRRSASAFDHQHVAGVEPGIHLHDRDAGARVAGLDRALDRRGAAPARQQRRVNVQAAQARQLEHPGRQDRARRPRRRSHRAAPASSARAPPARRRRYLPSSRSPRGWISGNAVRERKRLDRRRLQLHAAPGRAIGLCQHQRDVECAGMQPLQRDLARTRGVPANAILIVQARFCSSRVFFSILVLMRSRLSGLKYSTNTLPIR